MESFLEDEQKSENQVTTQTNANMESFLEDEQKSENQVTTQTNANMESFLEDEQKSENQVTTQTNKNTNVVYIDNNNRRVPDEETKDILFKMNLATRSILWELEPVEIKYLFSLMRINVNGKRVMTSKDLYRQLLREMCKKNKRNRRGKK